MTPLRNIQSLNCLALVVGLTLSLADEVRAVDFSRQVRPILSDHCFQCHGPDEEQRHADLRLDTEQGVKLAFAGGSFSESEAWRRITSPDPDEQMPPPDFRKPLDADKQAILKQWMEQKTPWSQHWAFVAPQRVEPPRIVGEPHPIDRFIGSKLSEEGLRLSQPASRETLIRRLKFDLLGLPPTLEEIDIFLGDHSPDAYERLVDKLLASPHYGERMAIEWLDGARYADTNGYQNDFKRSMWPWRDWVIEAFNENLPFDQFTRDQIAGDLLPDPSLQQRIATGFNRNNRTVTEAGSIPEEWLVENVIDRVETTATVFLGLTMGCARCHDHKYDPISQQDFYAFFSFFHNVKEKGVYQETRGNVAPLQPVLPEQSLAKLHRLREQLAAAEKTVAELRPQLSVKAKLWSRQDLEAATDSVAPASKFRLPLAGETAGLSSAGEMIEPTENSGTITWTDSLLGRVAKFSGLHTLAHGHAIAPRQDAPFALTFWVKPEKIGSILDKIKLDENSRGFDVYWQQDGRLELHFIHSWPVDAMKVSTKAKQTVPQDRWSHVAINYDGTGKAAGVLIHVNGKPVALKIEQDKLQNSFSVEEPIRIGRPSRGWMFFGSLTDLRYYDQQLTEGEIVAVARDGLAGIFPAETGGDLDRDESDPFRKERDALFGDFSNRPFAIRLREAEARVIALQKEITNFEASAQTVMVMEELSQPRDTFVLMRGEYDKPDETQPVTADTPAFLGKLPAEVKKDRLALANWMTSAENPLTARVRVNRLWQMLFGIGLVKTSENFGVQAEAPSHPELLDWLATEYIRSGWDTKQLLKLIVTSKTYRQSSEVSETLLKRDPANRLLARGPRFRLPAEMIRDNALTISGLLTTKIGGKSVRPYQPDKLWDELAGGAGEGKYVQSHGDDLYRRSLYTYRKRTVPHPTTSTFDAPTFEICQVYRERTNTPLQALALLNGTTYVEAARKLGERMQSEKSTTEAGRLAYGFRLATGRKPTDGERTTLVKSYQRKLKLFQESPEVAKLYLSHGEAKPRGELTPQSAAYAAVGSVLLNLDETITKE